MRWIKIIFSWHFRGEILITMNECLKGVDFKIEIYAFTQMENTILMDLAIIFKCSETIYYNEGNMWRNSTRIMGTVSISNACSLNLIHLVPHCCFLPWLLFDCNPSSKHSKYLENCSLSNPIIILLLFYFELIIGKWISFQEWLAEREKNPLGRN